MFLHRLLIVYEAGHKVDLNGAQYQENDSIKDGTQRRRTKTTRPIRRVNRKETTFLCLGLARLPCFARE